MKYRYRTDEEMKDSGIEWIGKIPKDWDISKWGYVTKILTDYTANGSFGDLAKNVKYLDYKEYARLVRLVDLRDNLNNQGIYVTKKAYDYLSKSSLYGDEFLIANVGANSGFVCKMPKVNYPCTLAPNMMMARFYEDKVDNDFMIYSANSSSIKTQLLAKATQSSAQPKLNKDDFRTTKFARPSLEMQRLIVQFLDEKISQFDSIISKKESLIEKLEKAKKSLISEVVTGKVKVAKSEKGYDIVPRNSEEMKDSGVEWLGLVPKEWKIKKLKHILSLPLKYGANESAELDDRLLPRYIRITDFGENGELKNDTFKSLPYEKAVDYMLVDGDILFARSGATVGKTFIFKNFNGEACFAGYLIKATVNKQCAIPEFVYMFTKSKNYENWKNSIFMQATIQNIGADKYKELKLSICDIKEQVVICDYLNYKERKLNNIITLLKSEIQKLKEAKQSLITEAVTGKIEILD